MFLTACVVFILITCLHFDFFPCVAVSACICSFACVYDIILLGVFRVCFDFDIYCPFSSFGLLLLIALLLVLSHDVPCVVVFYTIFFRVSSCMRT